MQTVDFARKRAQMSPHSLAFEDVVSGRTTTFAQLDERADRFSEALGRLGIIAGDRIAVSCHNTSVFFELLTACARTGAILVPLNWRQTPVELTPIVRECGAKLLLHDQTTAPLATAIAALLPIARVSFADFEPLLAEWSGAPWTNRAIPADRPWYLLCTSGTTGRPKMVIQTAAMTLANYVNVQQPTQLSSYDTSVNFLPLFHTAGLNLHTLPLLIAGGASLVLPKFDAEAMIRLLGSGRVTVFFGVPAVYQAMSLHPDFPSADFSHVRHWGCGGAALHEGLIRTYLDKRARVCNGMGMTETGPTIFFMDQAHAETKIGSVGRSQLLAEVRIVNERGQDVADGECGELLFRGPVVTPGYYQDPAATTAAFTPDGWLRSGDVGRRDGDGYYYIVDRIKDMYISGAENVYPAEVEAVLMRHPAVLEAVVVGVADERWGEVGHAAVRLHPEASASEDDIRAFARENLAAYKVPKYVTFVSDFPRTAAGKVQKTVLRTTLLEIHA